MYDIWSVENAGAMWVVTFGIAALFCALLIFFQWRAFSRAGFHGALALINLGIFVPVVGPLIVLGLQGWFAFAPWPALNKPPQS